MCSRDSEFTIRGTEDCLARGYDRNGFFEVDTGEQRGGPSSSPNTAEGPGQRPLTPPGHACTADAGPPRPRFPTTITKDTTQMRRLRRTKIVATLGPASPAIRK